MHAKYPFTIEAIVILPDHLHTIWSLHGLETDYSLRWRLIKTRFTKSLHLQHDFGGKIWQPRYWEHTIRNQQDFNRHVDYIHYNPVKHGYVNRACDWPYSSIHKFIRQGAITAGWGADAEILKYIGDD